MSALIAIRFRQTCDWTQMVRPLKAQQVLRIHEHAADAACQLFAARGTRGEACLHGRGLRGHHETLGLLPTYRRREF